MCSRSLACRGKRGKLDMSVGGAPSWSFGHHPMNSSLGVTRTAVACFSAAVTERLRPQQPEEGRSI